MCIICLGKCSGRRPREHRRIDPLRRHLIDLHLNHMVEDALRYALHSCQIEAGFTDAITFLRYTATVHDYDPKI